MQSVVRHATACRDPVPLITYLFDVPAHIPRIFIFLSTNIITVYWYDIKWPCQSPQWCDNENNSHNKFANFVTHSHIWTVRTWLNILVFFFFCGQCGADLCWQKMLSWFGWARKANWNVFVTINKWCPADSIYYFVLLRVHDSTDTLFNWAFRVDLSCSECGDFGYLAQENQPIREPRGDNSLFLIFSFALPLIVLNVIQTTR